MLPLFGCSAYSLACTWLIRLAMAIWHTSCRSEVDAAVQMRRTTSMRMMMRRRGRGAPGRSRPMASCTPPAQLPASLDPSWTMIMMMMRATMASLVSPSASINQSQIRDYRKWYSYSVIVSVAFPISYPDANILLPSGAHKDITAASPIL